MIGLSLSFCVQDVISGKVHPKEVTKIISGTKAPTSFDFAQVVAQYCNTYWKDDPKFASFVAWRLWDSGKIDQPRLRDEELPNIADGWWLKNGQRRRF